MPLNCSAPKLTCMQLSADADPKTNYPDSHYKKWADMPAEAQAAATTLGWTSTTWDEPVAIKYSVHGKMHLMGRHVMGVAIFLSMFVAVAVAIRVVHQWNPL